MATFAELNAAIEQVLSVPGTAAVLQLNSPTRERAFEAYVLGLIVRSIRQASGTADIHGIISGLNPVPIVFRGGGGLLGSTAQDFAFARCQLGSKEFELHLDVQYQGSSGAIHELDVSIYDKIAADRVRQTPNAFAKTGKLLGAIECKFYESSLGTALGRTFVGLLADCGALQLKMFSSNGLSQGLMRYFSPSGRPQRSFRLSPLRPIEENKFVVLVSQILSKWAGVL